MATQPDWALRIEALERLVNNNTSAIVNMQTSVNTLIDNTNRLVNETGAVIQTVNNHSNSISELQGNVATNTTNIAQLTRSIASLNMGLGSVVAFGSVLRAFNGTTMASGWQTIYTAPKACLVQLSVSTGPQGSLPHSTNLVQCGNRTWSLSQFIEVGDAWYIQVMSILGSGQQVKLFERDKRFTGMSFETL